MERQAEGPLSFYQRFLRITFHTFRCSSARAPTRVRIHIYTRDQIHTYTRVLFLFCPPPRLRRPLVLSSFTLHAVLSFCCLSSSFRAAFVLFVAIVRTCTRARARVCTCALSQSSYARFHVARLYAPAARGRLCTWVNGKMSFETFLGRSRSPHCQSYTREIPLSRKRSAAARRRPTMPRWLRAEFSVENAKGT